MAQTSFDSGSDKLPQRSVLHTPKDAENNWHPDLSREHPEWKAAHATQKDAAIAVDKDGVYVVKDGDTIYDIARRSLKVQSASTDSAAVKAEISKIVEHNVDAYPGLQTNPDLIHAGDQLRLGIQPETPTVLNVPPLPTDQAPAPVTPDVPPLAPVTPQAADVPDPALTTAPPAAAPPAAADITPAPLLAPPPLSPAPADLSGVPAFVPGPAPLVDGSTMVPPPYAAGPFPPVNGGSYTDQEAARLSQMMVNDPHAAANEMRSQIQQLDPQTASVLIAQTKNDEYVGGLGDLQVQVEYDQMGRDTGYRDVTMATQYGVEQIAELQSQPQYYNNGNPLGYIAGVVVGDLLWQQQRGLDFNDGRYSGWCNREQQRENYWNNNNGQFQQNWQNPNYRSNYQNQNWQSVAYNPTVNNTYVTNNRVDTTVINRPVNTTIINETINNSKTVLSNPKPITTAGLGQVHRVSGLPATGVATGRPEVAPVQPAQTVPIAGRPHAGAGEVIPKPVAPNVAPPREQTGAPAKTVDQGQIQRDQAAAPAKTQHEQEVRNAALATQAKAQHEQDVRNAALATQAKAQHEQDVRNAALATQAKAQHEQDVRNAALAAQAKAQHEQDVRNAALAAQAKAQHEQDVRNAALAAQAKAQHEQDVRNAALAAQAKVPPVKH